MTTRSKVLSVAVVSISLTFVSVWACLKISETYFFDKFYYTKSPTFGYVKPVPNPLGNSNNPAAIEERIKDLRLVFSDKKQKVVAAEKPSLMGRVLGVFDDQTTEAPRPYVVFLIGDSYVYGNGVRVSERMSAFLEKKLNAIRPTKVYTLAQSGDSIVDNYYKFQAAERVVQPDVVIMGMVVNDFILDQTDKYPDEQLFYLQLRGECPQEERKVQWTGPQMTPEDGMTLNLYPSISEEYANICYYEKILDRLEGKPILFYSFDPLSADPPPESEKYHWEGWQVMHAYVSRAQQHGLAVASPNNIENFVFKPRATIEGHPSVETHELFAESMFREITTNPRWGFVQE